MDRLTSIILWAGLGCFALAFLLSGLYPWLITDARESEASLEDVASWVSPDFKALKERYPVSFGLAFDEAAACLTAMDLRNVPAGDPQRETSEAAWRRTYATALRNGRDTYVSEGCWHCHSQYVRPVANEETRFGPVLTTRHDNNALQRPVLWGTRRVGPDLTHEGGKRSNDWHVAHLWDPQSTSPGSVMPRYVWYFRKGFEVRRTIEEDTALREGLPEDTSYPYPGLYESRQEAEAVIAALQQEPPANLEQEVYRLFVAEATGPDPDALCLIAYLQWLGTWDPDRKLEATR